MAAGHGAGGDTLADATVNGLLGESACMAVGLVIVAFLLAQALYRMDKDRWNSFWSVLERNLTALFAVTWMFGFCTYTAGMVIVEGIDSPWSLDCAGRMLRVVPMGIIHAFEMFLLESDISAVHDQFHNSIYFMTWFSLVHFMAALVSLIFVIKHFGYNIMARVHLWAASISRDRKERLYVFWGMNEPSYFLAKDIGRQTGQGSHRMLFIKTADDDDDTGSRTGIDRLFDFLSLKNKELDRLKDLKCLSTTAFRRISKCEITEDDKLHGCRLMAGQLGLKRVAKLIDHTSRELHLFFFSEDENSNIEAASNICFDSSIRAFAAGGRKVFVYVHARYDSINRVVEDAQSDKNIEVRIVDSAHNCINELRSTEAYHPINFVDIDTRCNVGTVASDFCAMVVGFGETGQDAARFLYEFGAFVDSGSSIDEDVPQQPAGNVGVRRSPFKCHVVDSRMNELKGRFMASVPALANGGSEFEFHACDVCSDGFYSLLQRNSSALNYVVVSLRDDELTITTAVRIFNYIRRNRADMSKFKIFVRCHNTLYEQHMRSIAAHYNQVYAATHCAGDECIVIYGSVGTLYTYGQIVNNEFEEEGKVYNNAYCQASGNTGPNDVWNSRRENLLKMKTLDGYSELRRKESQDLANAYHALTKLYIMKKVCDERPGDTALLQRALDGDAAAVPEFGRDSGRDEKVVGIVRAASQGGRYTDVEQLLLRNIARLEHLRWEASHTMLGYCSYSAQPPVEPLIEQQLEASGKDVTAENVEARKHGCNERLRRHNCIIGWEELDRESDNAGWKEKTGKMKYPDYKYFDFVVITTSLKLYIAKKYGRNQVHTAAH